MMDRHEVEYKVIQNAIQGDQRAYAILYDKYRGSLTYTILKIVRDPEIAMDLTMETFERAFAALDRYTPNFAFSTWIFRIGINCAIDYKRKSDRVQMVRIEQSDPAKEDRPVMEIIDPERNPAEESMKSHKRMAVRKMIKTLHEPFRTLVQLRYVDAFSYEEIAEELDLPLGTVKASLHRAKQILSERIKKNPKIRDILTEEL